MKDWRKANKRRNVYVHRKWLINLRLKYIWRCRASIGLDRTGKILEFCAVQMITHELYAYPSIRDAKYAILRQMWRFDKARRLNWHNWLQKNGWLAHSWKRR